MLAVRWNNESVDMAGPRLEHVHVIVAHDFEEVVVVVVARGAGRGVARRVRVARAVARVCRGRRRRVRAVLRLHCRLAA